MRVGVANLWCLAIGATLLGACARDCTEVGCLNGVGIDITQQFPVELLPVESTTCADKICNTQKIEIGQAAPGRTTFGIGPSVVLNADHEQDVKVSVVIRSLSTGEALISASGIAHLVRSQPNGGSCGPTCYGTSLAYDAASNTLVEQQ